MLLATSHLPSNVLAGFRAEVFVDPIFVHLSGRVEIADPLDFVAIEFACNVTTAIPGMQMNSHRPKLELGVR